MSGTPSKVLISILAVATGAGGMWWLKQNSGSSNATERPRPSAQAPYEDFQTDAGPEVSTTSDLSAAAAATSSYTPAPNNSVTDAATPYARVIEALERARDTPGNEVLIQRLTRMHNAILDSDDDPSWTRPTEQSVLYFLQSQPEIGTLEISSVTCRTGGCEIQALGGNLQSVIQRIRSAEIGNSLVPSGMYMTVLDGRSVALAMLKRRKAEGEEQGQSN